MEKRHNKQRWVCLLLGIFMFRSYSMKGSLFLSLSLSQVFPLVFILLFRPVCLLWPSLSCPIFNSFLWPLSFCLWPGRFLSAHLRNIPAEWKPCGLWASAAPLHCLYSLANEINSFSSSLDDFRSRTEWNLPD